MNIVLFGPPGAGKGTQAQFILKNFNLVQISTGDLLRQEINKNTILGNKIKEFIDQGNLVPDDIVNELLLRTVAEPSNFNRLIFDGYPRNLNQVKNLNLLMDNSNQKISAILFLDINKEIVIKRINERIYCLKCQKTFDKNFNLPSYNHLCDPKYLTKRTDDNLKTTISRFETYIKDTKPVLDYYKDSPDYHVINGSKNIDEISNEISSILSNIKN